MVQIAVIVIGVAFAITGIVLFIKGVGSSDISSFKLPGTEFRVPSNGLLVFVVGCGLIVIAATKIPPDPIERNVTPASTPTPAPTPTVTSTPSVSIDPLPQDKGSEHVIATRKPDPSDTAWYFTVSGTVSGIDATKHLSLLFHEAESTQGLWWVESSKPVGDRNEWSAEGYADARFFTDKRRPQQKVELRAVITDEELPASSHVKVTENGKFEKICLSDKGDPCPVPLSPFKPIVMSKIIGFKLKKSE